MRKTLGLRVVIQVMFETFGRADGKLSKKRQSGLSGTAVADTDCDEDDCERFF